MSFITKEYFENIENQTRARRLAWELANCTRGINNLHTSEDITLVAYLLYKYKSIPHKSNETLKQFLEIVPEDIRLLSMERLTEDIWQKLLAQSAEYHEEDLGMITLLPLYDLESRVKSEIPTPPSILALVNKLLDVNPGEHVGNIFCGCGSYLVSAALEHPNASFTGIEMNVEKLAITSMRAEFLEADVQTKLCNVFELTQLCNAFNTTSSNPVSFDKAFSNYPLGIKLRNFNASQEYLSFLTDKFPEISKSTSSDWIFNSLLYDVINENGKAIGIMTNGSTWNRIDYPMRKHFVENGMIECMISLPGKMYRSTKVPTTLIVMSKNNTSVRMIDATHLCKTERRLNVFREQDIAQILDAVTVDSPYSRTITLNEMREHDYSLQLCDYIDTAPSFKNGAPFNSIIKNITRGVPISARKLDELETKEPTNMQYLKLNGIQDGLIEKELPYLTSIDPKYEKYCLHNNNLLISKNGYPYKVALASVPETKKILVSGNFYIIELDEDKINPHYIRAFFDSKQGTAVLKSISVGAAIQSINVDNLKNAEIPIPSMEEQNRIATKYQSTLDEVAVIKHRLSKAEERLHHVLDEEVN